MMRQTSSSPPATYDAVYQAPFGPVAIVAGASGVSSVLLRPDPAVPVQHRPTYPAAAVLDWLDDYFRNPCASPELPLEIGGSPFLQRVLAALQNIPAGRVCRYGELAAALDSSARAVGQACGRNPLPLLIPCHRVVAATGPGGFMGSEKALHIKLWLLRHEGVL